MTKQEEEFLHLAICIENLNSSWRILQELKDKKGSPVLINAAFQFSLIEYSKSFKISYGNVSNEKRKLKLDTKYIPDKYLELHNRILNARDKLHAHSDLTLWDAKVYVRSSEYGKSVNYSKNNISGTEEFKNIESIIALIEETLHVLYKKEIELKQKLPTNE